MLKFFNQSAPQKIIFIIILVAIAFFKMHLVKLDYYDVSKFNNVDEQYYMKYAVQVSDSGIKSFPEMVKIYTNDEARHTCPHPLRVLYIIISSFCLNIFHSNDLRPLYYMSTLFSLLYLALIYFLGKNLFSNKIGTVGLLFAFSSPLILAMGRTALQESTVNFFIAASLLLFYLMIKNPKQPLLTLFFAISFICAILVKETSALFLPFFIIYGFLYKYYFKASILIIKSILILFSAIVAVIVVWAMASGGLSNAIKLFKIIGISPLTNDYAVLYGSGPWYRYLVDYLVLSPWVLILALGYIYYCLIDKKLTPANLYLILFFVYTLITFNFFTKNVRYVIFLDIPIRLLASLALIEMSQRFIKKYSTVFLITITCIIVVSDFMVFNAIFVKGGVYDPVSYFLLKEVHIVP